MKGRLSARLEKLEQRIPPKPRICRQLIVEPGESVEEKERLALDRMVADGEIDDSQRDDVFFIAHIIVEPKPRDVPGCCYEPSEA